VGGPSPTLTVDISFASRQPWVPSARRLQAYAAAALPRQRRPQLLSIRVVGDRASRSLNARFRGNNKPTNVLSFSGAGLLPDGTVELGELVICAPLVAREARQQGKTREAHWAHLTVHGVLHLLGMDHEQPSQAAKMESKELQILDRLGFSDPYA
jgi:probable rRNA maturation factor